jgi:hypothetical protein
MTDRHPMQGCTRLQVENNLSGWGHYEWKVSKVKACKVAMKLVTSFAEVLAKEFKLEGVDWPKVVLEGITNKSGKYQHKIKTDAKKDPASKWKRGEDESKIEHQKRVSRECKRLEGLEGEQRRKKSKTGECPAPASHYVSAETPPSPATWSLEEEAAEDDVQKNEVGTPITMAFVKGSKKKELLFPEDVDEGWSLGQWEVERPNIVTTSYEDATPATCFHGHILKHIPRVDLRMAIVKFNDKMQVRCSLDPTLRRTWWWYGHLGEDGKTEASCIEQGPKEVALDDLFV